jgi:hypothetical protein
MKHADVMTHVYRAACKVLEEGPHPDRSGAFQNFLIGTGEKLDLSAIAWMKVKNGGGPVETKEACDALLQMAVSALITVAHFPKLGEMSTPEGHRKESLG